MTQTTDICKHCGQPIDYDEGRGPELNAFAWRHVNGEPTRSGSLPRRCFGYPCEDEAEPVVPVDDRPTAADYSDHSPYCADCISGATHDNEVVRCRCTHDTSDPERGCECGYADAVSEGDDRRWGIGHYDMEYGEY